MRRVVITGCGVVSPLGSNIPDFWSSVKSGRCGIRSLADDDLVGVKARVVGKVEGYDASEYYSGNGAKKNDLFVQYGVAAAKQAFVNSAIDPAQVAKNPFRYGVAVGAGIGGLDSIEQNYQRAIDRGASKISPHFVPATIINMVAGNISINHGFQGPNVSVVTACASGTHNIGMAAQMIASNSADYMLCGGAEYSSVMLAMGGFSVMRALSYNPDPLSASRPFDVNRDGFVLSDGSGIVALEDYEHAVARGAPIIAEIVGFGMTADAHHVTQPVPGGLGAKEAMRLAIASSGCSLSDIGYVNAHGTSTYHNDKTEAQVISELFDEHAKSLMVSSTKSMLGHQLGAAGAVEAIICAMALQEQVIPATINCHEPEPDIKFDLVRNQMREHSYNYALSNSFGFGGNNASLVIKKI